MGAALLGIITRRFVVLFAFAAATTVGDMGALVAQGHVREVTVTARACSFSPGAIEVSWRDRVRVTFVAEDAPHAFVIAAYRVSKRATPDRTVTFEFLADQAGAFVFLSDLASDADCPDMRGELVVADRSR